MTLAPIRPPSPPGPSLCFDLENRPLAYWYDGATTAEITAFGWKWEGEPCVRSMVLRRDGRFDTEEGRILRVESAYRRFVDELYKAGVVFGHNIRRHDLPLLNAGLLRLKLPPLRPLLTCDTLRDYPRRKDMSASLENLAALYELGGEKHHMSQIAWERANRLVPAGLEEAALRVESDVLLQERLREKLLELHLLRPPSMWRG